MLGNKMMVDRGKYNLHVATKLLFGS